MKKFFGLMCSLYEVHIKNKLVVVKTTYGYALFKKIENKWCIGTISYIPKTQEKRVSVNLFTHVPVYKFGIFIIGKNTIPIDSISFKKQQGIFYHHHGSWGWGFIKKSKIKQMSAL
jgi:hypothetical protein